MKSVEELPSLIPDKGRVLIARLNVCHGGTQLLSHDSRLMGPDSGTWTCLSSTKMSSPSLSLRTTYVTTLTGLKVSDRHKLECRLTKRSRFQLLVLPSSTPFQLPPRLLPKQTGELGQGWGVNRERGPSENDDRHSLKWALRDSPSRKPFISSFSCLVCLFKKESSQPFLFDSTEKTQLVTELDPRGFIVSDSFLNTYPSNKPLT